MQKTVLASLVLGAAALAVPAQAATTIDFDAIVTGPSYTEAGVTFTPLGGTFVFFMSTPNGTPGLLAEDNSNGFFPAQAVISGGASFVSVDLGDFGGDTDDLFLRAYDLADTFLGEDTLTIPDSFGGMETLSVAFANIARVEFGGVGVRGSSVFADNFTFEASGAVPEPATWATMLLGMFGIGGVMRRRKVTTSVSYA